MMIIGCNKLESLAPIDQETVLWTCKKENRSSECIYSRVDYCLTDTRSDELED